MAQINQTDRYHSYYLFANDISEDKYNGLSHVTEHTLLIPTDIRLQFAAQGYTCNSHVCLYFSSEALETLQEIDRKLMCGELITDENVSCAKYQVTQEILSLQENTRQNERLLSFVTDNRIQRCAIGDPTQIAKIQPADIQSWFEERKRQSQIYRFIFKDAHEMILSTPISNSRISNVARGADKIGVCH